MNVMPNSKIQNHNSKPSMPEDCIYLYCGKMLWFPPSVSIHKINNRKKRFILLDLKLNSTPNRMHSSLTHYQLHPLWNTQGIFVTRSTRRRKLQLRARKVRRKTNQNLRRENTSKQENAPKQENNNPKIEKPSTTNDTKISEQFDNSRLDMPVSGKLEVTIKINEYSKISTCKY